MKQIPIMVNTVRFFVNIHVFPNKSLYVGTDNILQFFGLADDHSMSKLLAEGSRHGVQYTETVVGGPRYFMVPREKFGHWLISVEKYITEENQLRIFRSLAMNAVTEVTFSCNQRVTIADIWKLEDEIKELRSEVQQLLIKK